MQSKIMDNWAYMRLNADLISASLFKGDTRLIWLPGTLSINENCLWIAARCCPLLPDAEATALRQSCGYGIGQMIGHRSSMRQIGPKSSLTSANRASNCTQMLAIKTHFTSFLKGKQKFRELLPVLELEPETGSIICICRAHRCHRHWHVVVQFDPGKPLANTLRNQINQTRTVGYIGGITHY